jgi:hypothetical protein
MFALASVCASATTAYVIVFWTPWFGARGEVWGSYYSHDYFVPLKPPYTGGNWSSSGFGDAGRLVDDYPEIAQRVLTAIFNDLMKMPNDKLYILKSVDDACGTADLDCRTMTSKEVKPLMEAALAHRQNAETAMIAWRSLYVAAGGLFLSLLSLCIAFLIFLSRNNRPVPPRYN